MRTIQKCGILGSLVVGLLAAIPAHAQVQTPTQVPGKEYSDTPDKDAAGAPDPEQTLLWDGNGNVSDGFDYGGDQQVDGMANIRDAEFDQVIRNQATLLFSTTGDVPAPFYLRTSWGIMEFGLQHQKLTGMALTI